MENIFVYGTLKKGEPNSSLMGNGNEHGVYRFVDQALTVDRWPMVIASSHNIPFLLDNQGVGKVRIIAGFDEDQSGDGI